jgi:hypothetical protein
MRKEGLSWGAVWLAVWVVCWQQLRVRADVTPTISDVNILLPFTGEERAPYVITATGGCFKWKSHDTELVVVTPRSEGKKKCAAAAEVIVSPSFSYAGRSRNTWIEVSLTYIRLSSLSLFFLSSSLPFCQPSLGDAFLMDIRLTFPLCLSIGSFSLCVDLAV